MIKFICKYFKLKFKYKKNIRIQFIDLKMRYLAFCNKYQNNKKFTHIKQKEMQFKNYSECLNHYLIFVSADYHTSIAIFRIKK